MGHDCVDSSVDNYRRVGRAVGQESSGGIVQRKKKRMPFVAMNDLLIFGPSACFLAGEVNADALVYEAQAPELVAGAVNLTLMDQMFVMDSSWQRIRYQTIHNFSRESLRPGRTRIDIT